jgi:AcrB/AcrD/AcrF family protein
MEYAGISLQRISLGALIISLGLLVDDAMITIEMMVSQLEAGVDREHSATHAWVTTAFPVLTGTLVTVAGFVPIGFAKSGAGEYCYSLFVVIAVALLASWIVAVPVRPGDRCDDPAAHHASAWRRPWRAAAPGARVPPDPAVLPARAVARHRRDGPQPAVGAPWLS